MINTVTVGALGAGGHKVGSPGRRVARMASAGSDTALRAPKISQRGSCLTPPTSGVRVCGLSIGEYELAPRGGRARARHAAGRKLELEHLGIVVAAQIGML